MKKLGVSEWILIIASLLLIGGIVWAFSSGEARIEFELIELADAAS